MGDGWPEERGYEREKMRFRWAFAIGSKHS